MAKTKRASTKKKVATPVYFVTLVLGAERYEVKASSVQEGLLKITPQRINLRGRVIVNYQGKTYEKEYFPFQLKLLLTNALRRSLFEKNALLYMK